MSEGSRSGWICAGLLWGSACLFGVFGWVGLVLGILVCCFLLGIKLGGEQRAPRRSIKLPTETCQVAAGQRCPLCHADFEVKEVVETCAGCGTLYHQGCREEWRVCATLGCRKRKRTLRSQGGLFLVGEALAPRVHATPKVRRKILLRRDPSSGVLEVPPDQSLSFAQPEALPDPPPLPELARRPGPDELSRAAQRVLQRRVAS
jgi:hypothetical protein